MHCSVYITSDSVESSIIIQTLLYYIWLPGPPDLYPGLFFIIAFIVVLSETGSLVSQGILKLTV